MVLVLEYVLVAVVEVLVVAASFGFEKAFVKQGSVAIAVAFAFVVVFEVIDVNANQVAVVLDTC